MTKQVLLTHPWVLRSQKKVTGCLKYAPQSTKGVARAPKTRGYYKFTVKHDNASATNTPMGV